MYIQYCAVRRREVAAKCGSEGDLESEASSVRKLRRGKKKGKGKEIISRHGGEEETQDTIRIEVEGEKQFNQVMTKTVSESDVTS